MLVEEHGERMDPTHSVTHRIQADIPALLNAFTIGLARTPSLRPNPLLALCTASVAMDDAVATVLEGTASSKATLSEAGVARHLCSVLSSEIATGSDETFFASNSMPIRHVDMCCAHAPSVLCNRGASGIDGILHTAIGTALGGGGRCTLLVGDLAALHDLNGLASLSGSGLPLVVVVLNNAGGGIFRYLPIANHEDVYSPYFDTPHAHGFAKACEGFRLPYSQPQTLTDFEAAFAAARRAGGGPHVIEVLTDKEASHALNGVLKQAGAEAAANLVRALTAAAEVS